LPLQSLEYAGLQCVEGCVPLACEFPTWGV
jgi:hypothetical protein